MSGSWLSSSGSEGLVLFIRYFCETGTVKESHTTVDSAGGESSRKCLCLTFWLPGRKGIRGHPEGTIWLSSLKGWVFPVGRGGRARSGLCQGQTEQAAQQLEGHKQLLIGATQTEADNRLGRGKRQNAAAPESLGFIWRLEASSFLTQKLLLGSPSFLPACPSGSRAHPACVEWCQYPVLTIASSFPCPEQAAS